MDIDRTRSKRPIRDESDNEQPMLDAIQSIGDNLDSCQELAYSLGLDKKYNKAVAISHARFIDLFEKSCKIPMTVENIAKLAEVRGRMSERLRLTLEMDSLKHRIKDQGNRLSIFEKMLARLKQNKKGNEND